MQKRAHRALLCALIAGLSGLVNGLLGAGGGVLLALGLGRFPLQKGQTPHSVFATVTAVMLPLSLFSAYRYYTAGHLSLSTLPTLALPCLLGGAIGAFSQRYLHASLLKRLFGLLVLISGILMLVR